MRLVEALPLIVEAIARLRVSSIVLDGEAMSFDHQGGHDFDALWNGTNDHHARLCAFDFELMRGLPGEAVARCARSGSPGYSRRPAMVSTTSSTWRVTVRLSSSMLQAEARRHRLQTGGPSLPERSLKELAEGEEPGAPGDRARKGSV